MSAMTESQYIRLDGGYCPNCVSPDIEGDGNIQIDGLQIWQQIKCNTCHATWTDYYNLAGYDNLDIPGR